MSSEMFFSRHSPNPRLSTLVGDRHPPPRFLRRVAFADPNRVRVIQ